MTRAPRRFAAVSKLNRVRVEGSKNSVATTLPFGTFVFEQEAFLSGRFDTHFVNDFYTPEKITAKQKANAEAAALIAVKYWLDQQKITQAVNNQSSGWRRRLA